MINKFQQGGKQDAVMQFVLGLALTLLADPLQVILIAQQNPQALEAAILTYQQTKDIKLAAQTFQQAVQLQTQAARHGAKLNYIKSLKNQCAEDEEVVYYKKGGSVGCGCKKKEDGGEIKKEQKGGSVVDRFKSKLKEKLEPKPQQNTTDSVLDPKTMKRRPVTEEDKKKWKKNQEDAKLGKGEGTPQRKSGGELKKDCGGSKMKLQKKGGEVCPKCGKVHAAGIGCAVAKFKAHRQGGTLYFK